MRKYLMKVMSMITPWLPSAVLRARCTELSREQKRATYFNRHVEEVKQITFLMQYIELDYPFNVIQDLVYFTLITIYISISLILH
jgi:hypothetical protein